MAKGFAFRISPEDRMRLEIHKYIECHDQTPEPGYEEWVIEELKAAIAEADAGEFATDEEVQAIFRKYMYPNEN